ncbi:hypothetical protein D3C85_1340600 [compost metagenome]
MFNVQIAHDKGGGMRCVYAVEKGYGRIWSHSRISLHWIPGSIKDAGRNGSAMIIRSILSLEWVKDSSSVG